MASPTTKITLNEFVAVDLAGRRFRSREGRSHLRGVVRGAALQDGLLTISVGSVVRQQGSTQNPVPDFEYQGKAEITSVWRAANGQLSIDIMYIGAIVILPPEA